MKSIQSNQDPKQNPIQTFSAEEIVSYLSESDFLLDLDYFEQNLEHRRSFSKIFPEKVQNMYIHNINNSCLLFVFVDPGSGRIYRGMAKKTEGDDHFHPIVRNNIRRTFDFYLRVGKSKLTSEELKKIIHDNNMCEVKPYFILPNDYVALSRKDFKQTKTLLSCNFFLESESRKRKRATTTTIPSLPLPPPPPSTGYKEEQRNESSPESSPEKDQQDSNLATIMSQNINTLISDSEDLEESQLDHTQSLPCSNTTISNDIYLMANNYSSKYIHTIYKELYSLSSTERNKICRDSYQEYFRSNIVDKLPQTQRFMFQKSITSLLYSAVGEIIELISSKNNNDIDIRISSLTRIHCPSLPNNESATNNHNIIKQLSSNLEILVKDLQQLQQQIQIQNSTSQEIVQQQQEEEEADCSSTKSSGDINIQKKISNNNYTEEEELDTENKNRVATSPFSASASSASASVEHCNHHYHNGSSSSSSSSPYEKVLSSNGIEINEAVSELDSRIDVCKALEESLDGKHVNEHLLQDLLQSMSMKELWNCESYDEIIDIRKSGMFADDHNQTNSVAFILDDVDCIQLLSNKCRIILEKKQVLRCCSKCRKFKLLTSTFFSSQPAGFRITCRLCRTEASKILKAKKNYNNKRKT